MKHGLILMLICFLGLTSLNSGDRYIHWSSTRPLMWCDYQGSPLPSDSNGAVTYAFLDRTYFKKNLILLT